MRKHFTEAATEKCSSNLCLTAIIKIILMPAKESNFQKRIKPAMKKTVVHSQPFIKIVGSILLLTVRFVKSSDQTIIQLIRKINQF